MPLPLLLLKNHRTLLRVGLVLSCLCHCCIRPAHPFVVVVPRTTELSPKTINNHPGSSWCRDNDIDNCDGNSRSKTATVCAMALHGKPSPEPEQNENNETEEENVEEEEIGDDDPVEEFLAMQEASRKVQRRLMMPRMILDSIGRTIQFLAYAFILGNFALNIAGYAIIREEDSVRIGTLNDQAFQMEIDKSMKEETNNKPPP